MSFSEDTIKKVWDKAKTVPGNDTNVWRKDQCGAWIGWSYYGNRKSQYGWEIDHITPESEGGGNEISNLRPLQWENNAARQNARLSCPVTASGKENYRR